MRSFLALMRREYLEHRAAFLYAPLILVGLLAAAVLTGMVSGRFESRLGPSLPDFQTLFEFGYAAVAWGWWYYLLAALFFYYADAFNADRRNNSMLFWKSMPQSDFKILGSKMVVGLTIFPVLLFSCILLSGILVYVASRAASFALPNLVVTSVAAATQSWANVSVVVFVYLAISLLWYAPFFAWVGALSTMVGRWSIPLSFLIPGILVLFENAVTKGNGPVGGYIYQFLTHRSTLRFDGEDIASTFLSGGHVDPAALISRIVSGTDWLSLLGGLVFAVLATYAASEYRRRAVIA
jgi:ABC-2 type transport system permease protein